jgi:3-oxoacyl-[acyl-carrier-protein] synthase II
MDVDYHKTVIPDRGTHASPALCSYTLANGFLGEAAIRFGFTGINYVITDQRSIGLAGLQTALDHIVRGVLKKFLVVIVMWIVRRFLANPLKCRPVPFF